MSRVTLQHIADATGLSRMTVSRGLRNLPEVREDKRLLIQKTAKELGYVPDAQISQVMGALGRKNTTVYRETLGFIQPHPDWLAEKELKLIREEVERMGYRLDVIPAWEQGDTQALARVLQARGIRGVILAPDISCDFPTFDLQWENFSAVLLGSSLVNEGLPRVRPAYFQSSMLAMRRVHELGYRHPVLVVDASQNIRTGHAFTSAFYSSGFRYGWEDPPARILQRSHIRDTDWLARLREQAVDVILSHSFHAFEQLREDEWFASEQPVLVSLNKCNHSSNITGVEFSLSELAVQTVHTLLANLNAGLMGLRETAPVIEVPGQWREGLNSA